MNTSQSVVQTMRSFIQSWEAQEDRRAIFLTCYAMMTGNMTLALEANEFQDQAWVAALLHHFANYYFEALHAYDAGVAEPSSVWYFTFEAARTSNLHVIQNMLLGVNAHICHDLVFALAEQMRDWSTLNEAQRAMRYRDHCHVNEIIFRTINKVQDEVIERHSPLMELVDDWMGTLDEWLLQQVIIAWRDEVWNFATRLLCCADETEISTVRHLVEARALHRATIIAGQKGIAGFVGIF